MKRIALPLCAFALAGSAFSQSNVPEVALGQGDDRYTLTQTTFLPNGSGGVVDGSLFPGQNQGAGIYFEGYYWLAVPTTDYNGTPGNAITLFPVAGVDAPDASLPDPFRVEAMNIDGEGNPLFAPLKNVELAVWEAQLWVLCWEPESNQVHFAPLSKNPEYKDSDPSAAPFFATNPSKSSNYIQDGDLAVLGLSAEVVEGELVILTWVGSHPDGYSLGVSTSGEGDFFTTTRYLSLGEELKYGGIFDTHVYTPDTDAALPGATPGVLNVLVVAASENAGRGGNQDLLLWSATLDELKSLTSFPVTEAPYLGETGLFTEDPGNIFVLELSDGAVDASVGPHNQPAITIGVLYQVAKSPHFPWFIATAPLSTGFDPGSDGDIPAFTYPPDGGVSPPFGPNYSFSLGIQRVRESNGDVQDYAMFAAAVELSGDGGGTIQGYVQAAKANELRLDDLTIADTSDLSRYSDQPDVQASFTQAWRLLGVIHGPPPLAFNGDRLNNTSVTINWGSTNEDTRTSSVTSSSKTTYTEQATGKTPVFSITGSGTQSFVHASGTSESVTSKLSSKYSQTLNSVDSGGDVANLGWLLYLMPKVHNQAYKAYNFLGDDLDRVVYLTWIGDIVMEAIPYAATDPSQPSTFDGTELSLADGITPAPAVDDPDAWNVVPAGPDSVEVWDAPRMTYSTDSSFTGSLEYTSSDTGGTTNNTSSTYGWGAKVQIGGEGKDDKQKAWGFNVGGSWESDTTNTYELASTATSQLNEGVSVHAGEIFVRNPPTNPSYRSVTVTPRLLFPEGGGDGNWIPAGKPDSTPFLLTWGATATPVSGEVDANFGALWVTGTNRFVSDAFGTLAFAGGGLDRGWAWSSSLSSWLRGANGSVDSAEYGRLTGVGSSGWVRSSVFGSVHFGVDPDRYDGWVWTESLGWMYLVRDPDGNVVLYADSLRGWFSVRPSGELYSFDYRTLVALEGARFRSPVFGDLTVGPFGGWIFTDRFGWLAASRDGTATWFWSVARGEWLGVTPEGGIWSTAEERFL